MGNFKDFVKSKRDKKIINPHSSTNLVHQIGGILATTNLVVFGGKTNKKSIERFASEAVELANSEEVLTELSDAIGDPKENESEDEFVERAKTAFFKIMKNKLERHDL